MKLFITIIILLIFAETTILCVKSFGGKNRHLGQMPRRKVFVDTSTLMDGRILAVAKSGFLGDEILIPRSVIRELQLLADGPDSEKRTRARFGLDIVNELERVELADVEIFADDTKRVKVDERLIELAKENRGMILTNDFNLIKVAATEKVDAININELAQSLRSEYLPGDHLNVKIISVGSNAHQGVAYLPDGTMVVVDEADRFAGKNMMVEIEFVRYLQTNAGKMMFAKLAPRNNKPQKRKIADRKSGRKPNKNH
ncbi:MAG: hypothetical protein Q4D22_02485 [Candidatus Saccharibacteria bacterium]|jgi:uncharacterized protein YacL|nr:hypothetical protein [Candidatus Saccharibacteria bacterium]